MQGRSHTLQNAHFSKKFSLIYKLDVVIKLLFITETKSYYFVQPSTYIYSRTSRCCIIKAALYTLTASVAVFCTQPHVILFKYGEI